MLTIELLPHPLMVTIVFLDKYWGTSVGYESRGTRVQVLQIDSVNELKELLIYDFKWVSTISMNLEYR